MSAVLVTATDNFIIFMSDGQVLYDNKEIVDENYKKLIRVNNNICVGFTGDLSVCNKITESIRTFNTENVDLEFIYKTLYLKSEKVYNFFNGADFNIIVGGKSIEGEIEYYVINSKTGVTSKQYKPYGNMIFNLAGNVNGGKSILGRYLSKELKRCSDINYVIDAMKNSIEEISKHEHSVNNHTFTEIIKR